MRQPKEHQIVSVIAWLILVCTVFSFTISQVVAQDLPVLEIAPPNPDFVNHMEQMRFLRAEGLSEEGHSLGFIPPTVDRSHLSTTSLDRASAFERLGAPTVYDLRTQGRLTPIRDQGNCGSCWAFAAMGSLESNLLSSTSPQQAWDFSENNLKNTSGFDWGDCDGGNGDLSAAYLTRWSGPVSEADDPYDVTSGSSPSNLTVRKHVQEVIYLPDRTGSTDNDAIKQAIMSFGAVQTSMYYGSAYYRADTHAYYNSHSYNGNHAVVIVGWNDDYSASNFSPIAPAKGAFIVRNSWGSSWGENGYFYVSYYDATIGKYNYAFRKAKETTNFARVYQYDKLGWVLSYGNGTDSASFANIFTAVENESLAAIGFYSASEDSTYQVEIYTNAASGPTSGLRSGTASGTLTYAGYHTVTLPTAVPLTAGQKFSIVVQLTTPGYNWPVAIEYPYSDYSSLARASAGQSYVIDWTGAWVDITQPYPNTNVCLKGYTTKLEADFEASVTSGRAPLRVAFTNKTVGNATSYLWDFGDGGTSTLASPVYYYRKAGTYTVTLKVTGPTGESTETKSAYITAYALPRARFTVTPRIGRAPLTPVFTDLSTGTITSRSWEFGTVASRQKLGSSNLQTPPFAFDTPGLYWVKLTTTGQVGTSTVTSTMVQRVMVRAPLTAR